MNSSPDDGRRLKIRKVENLMETLTPIERLVLEETSRGPETLEQIRDHLRLPLAEAADAVRSLVDRGMVSPRTKGEDVPQDLSRIWKAAFEPTSKGRDALAEVLPEPSPRARISAGMFAGLIPPITAEEMDEARREMWGGWMTGARG